MVQAGAILAAERLVKLVVDGVGCNLYEVSCAAYWQATAIMGCMERGEQKAARKLIRSFGVGLELKGDDIPVWKVPDGD